MRLSGRVDSLMRDVVEAEVGIDRQDQRHRRRGIRPSAAWACRRCAPSSCVKWRTRMHAVQAPRRLVAMALARTRRSGSAARGSCAMPCLNSATCPGQFIGFKRVDALVFRLRLEHVLAVVRPVAPRFSHSERSITSGVLTSTYPAALRRAHVADQLCKTIQPFGCQNTDPGA